MRTALSEYGAAVSRNGIGAPSGNGTWLERWSVWSNVCSELAALLAMGWLSRTDWGEAHESASGIFTRFQEPR